jgi:biopolymer transport protein TolR
MRRKQHDQPVSDINITPLTDVMLVLLVIFMISSPVLLAKGMEVHLPQVSDAPALVEEDHVLYLSEDQILKLDGVDIVPGDLYEAFTGMVAEADETGEVVNLFFRADATVTYGDITAVMDLATQAGIERISLVQDVVSPGTNGDITDPTNTDGEGISDTG